MHDPDHLGIVLDGDEGDPRSPAGRRHERSRRRHRSRRRGRRAVILLVALALVAGGAFGAWTALKPMVGQLTASKDYSGQGTGTVEVVVEAGASGRAIGRSLEKAGVVKTAGAFVDAAANEPRSGSIQPGTYTLRQHMSGAAAVALLLTPSARTADRVTVREGLRASEIVTLLARASGEQPDRYTAALKDPASLGLPAAAHGKVEGWLFPDTYEFAPTSTPAEQLAAMIAHAKKVLRGLGVTDSEAQNVLTTASIAEVEASRPDDYAKIARVLDNRIARHMKLQLDSTVSYAVGKRTITTTAAERATQSPYNTYLVAGLPAGPISNPGKKAIEGALNPTPGPWLFFVAVNPTTGDTRFATTKAEHDKNVALFRQWCKANPGQC